MAECSFCSADIEPGTGKMYVKRNGDVMDFCSSKCQRNQLGLKRVNRYTKWTGKARALKAEGKS